MFCAVLRLNRFLNSRISYAYVKSIPYSSPSSSEVTLGLSWSYLNKKKRRIKTGSRFRKAQTLPVELSKLPEQPLGTSSSDDNPPKLFMIHRTKPLKGRPWWEKDIITSLGLADESSDVVIVKNVPHVNEELWKVKHLIKITPINFPNGEPPRDRELWGTKVNEYGDFRVPERLQIPEEALLQQPDDKKMDTCTIKERLRLRWLNHAIFD